MSNDTDIHSNLNPLSLPVLLSRLTLPASESYPLLPHFLRLYDSSFYSSLFSVNEFLDDLSTTTLPYLALPYYIAYLYDEGKHTMDKEVRLNVLKEAKTFYNKFLSSAEQYEIVERRAKTETTIFDNDPVRIRYVKVQRFKYIKELEQQTSINVLFEEHADEEFQRQHGLLFLRLLVAKAEDALEQVETELELLLKFDDDEHHSPTTSQHSHKVSKVTRPFVLTKTRTDIANTVFKPGHNLPTMTIDEYLELEHKHGNITSQSSDRDKHQESHEGEEQEGEMERQKLIQRDEWFDEHRRGEGNRYNRS